jgi:hypothetical protein
MIEIGCPPHSSPSLALGLSLLCTPRHHTAAMLPRCTSSTHRVAAIKPALSRVRSPCLHHSHAVPFILLWLPLLSLFCCTSESQSPRRRNLHAHCPAMRDVPTHAPPLRLPCPSSFASSSTSNSRWVLPPLFPSSAFLPQVRVCVIANDALVCAGGRPRGARLHRRCHVRTQWGK